MATIELQAQAWGGGGKLRELLRLIALLRGDAPPLTDPEGLRRALNLLLQLATVIGLDPALIERLKSILENETTFHLVLGLVRFIVGLLDGHDAANQPQALATVEPQALIEWLPLVLQLIGLWRKLHAAA